MVVMRSVRLADGSVVRVAATVQSETGAVRIVLDTGEPAAALEIAPAAEPLKASCTEQPSRQMLRLSGQRASMRPNPVFGHLTAPAATRPATFLAGRTASADAPAPPAAQHLPAQLAPRIAAPEQDVLPVERAAPPPATHEDRYAAAFPLGPIEL